MLFCPGFFNWDAAVFKNTMLTERIRLEFRAESFNVLNHPNFGLPASNISVPATVGRIASASDPRDIQIRASVGVLSQGREGDEERLCGPIQRILD
jgi:hypothetical protein